LGYATEPFSSFWSIRSMIPVGMEDIESQHETGHICTVCGGIAVVDLDDGYLCAGDAVEAMATIDLRAEGPVVAASTA